MTAEAVTERDRLLAACVGDADLGTSLRALSEHLAGRGFGDADVDVLAERGTLADVGLVAAALLGDPVALRTSDDRLRKATRECASRMRLSDTDAAEVAQLLRRRLLIDADEDARARTYDGRGPLLAWLRVCATRQALMFDRRVAAAREVPLQSAAAIEPLLDPELRVVAAEDLQAVKRAFQVAFGQLDSGQKTLLAYHLLDGRTHREVGRILRVNASTVSRRLAEIRASLLRGTQEALVASAVVSPKSLETLLVAVRSQLDVSVARLLRESGDDE